MLIEVPYYQISNRQKLTCSLQRVDACRIASVKIVSTLLYSATKPSFHSLASPFLSCKTFRATVRSATASSLPTGTDDGNTCSHNKWRVSSQHKQTIQNNLLQRTARMRWSLTVLLHCRVDPSQLIEAYSSSQRGGQTDRQGVSCALKP